MRLDENHKKWPQNCCCIGLRLDERVALLIDIVQLVLLEGLDQVEPPALLDQRRVLVDAIDAAQLAVGFSHLCVYVGRLNSLFIIHQFLLHIYFLYFFFIIWYG